MHEVIEAQPEWVALLEVTQRYGETLRLEDAARRGNMHIIKDVCDALSLRHRKLDPLPQRSRDYLSMGGGRRKGRQYGGPTGGRDGPAPVWRRSQ